MSSKANTKISNTTLDSLPYGEPSEADYGKVGKTILPDGVSRKAVLKDVIVLALPSFVELVLTQLTSMADQVMVGRLPGQEGIMALSAVGLSTQPKFLLMTMIQAMNVGATALIARSRGQQDREKANRIFKHALLLNFIMSAVFMIIGLLAARPLISFMSGQGIAGETFELAVEYLKIQLYGFIPLCMGFTITAALRGIGDSRTPMIYNTVANVVNLIFNYVMIYGKFGCPKMGVAGASWATVIGQTVAFIIAAVVIIRKKHYVYFSFKEKFTFDRSIMKGVSDIGIPSMVEQLFTRAGIILFARTVAGLGETLFATHQVLMSVQGMTFMIGQAFATATTTLMGQSLGKRRFDMALVYMRETRFIGRMVSIGLMVLIVLLNDQIIALYNSDPTVIETGAMILFLLAASQPFQSDQFIVSGGLRGAGDTKYTAMVMLITMLGVRTGICMLLVNVFDFGLWGAWIALVADQILRTFLMVGRYYTGRWKRMGLKRYEHSTAKG